MKRVKRIITLMISVALIASFNLPIFAYAKEKVIETRTIMNPEYEYTVPSSMYPESSHNYANNSDINYGFYYPNAKSLQVTFSSDTKTEYGYDYIYVVDGNNSIIGKYSGRQLANETISIPTPSFRIALISDSGLTYYGFSITKIEAELIPNSYVKESTYSSNYYDYAKPYSSHNYSNNTDETFYYSNSLAKSLTLDFSSSCKTEYGYDYIYIYDSKDNLIGKYTGRQLASERVVINDSSFSIRLTSDKSQTYYGYSIDNIVASYEKGLDNDETAYPESSHKYDNYANETYKFDLQYDDIDYLAVTFSDKTETEANYDFISVIDENGNVVGKYSGTELAGKTLELKGDSFSIKLESDKSKSYYGFSIDSITYIITEQDVPNPISSYTVTPLDAGFKVNWAPIPEVDGYEIQYSSFSDFEVYEIEDMPDSEYSARQFTSLYQDHTYYVRIRTYRYIDGEKVYSTYSDVKDVQTYVKLTYYYNQNDYGDEDNPDHDYSRPDGEKKTIKTSGCGVVSTVIALNNLEGREYYGVTEVAQFSMNHGARDEYGTNLVTLLNELMKYNSHLSYKITSYGSELVSHLQNGGIAIINQSESKAKNGYPLFSTNGHYVVGYYADSDGNVHVADPAYTDTRYKTDFCQANIVRETNIGCVANISIINKATDNDCYYLLYYN